MLSTCWLLFFPSAVQCLEKNQEGKKLIPPTGFLQVTPVKVKNIPGDNLTNPFRIISKGVQSSHQVNSGYFEESKT